MRACADCGADISYRNPSALICFSCFKERSKTFVQKPREREQRGQPRPPQLTVRAATIGALFLAGKTYQEIGDQQGMTRQRVQQIVKQAGIASADGGAALARRERQVQVRLSKETGCMAKHGCTVDERRHFQSLGMVAPFISQRKNAAGRGIEWKFTLGDWCRFWLASGKWDERGRGADRYCMSRDADSGAYEIGNVSIKRNSENAREAMVQWVGKTKTHRGVFLLYPGRERPWQAKYGRKSIGYFATGEEAADARDAYMALHNLKAGGQAGQGRGWTFQKRNKIHPYFMRAPGGRRGYFASPDEARAAYLAACAEHAMTKNL